VGGGEIPVVSEIPLLSCVFWLTWLGGRKGGRAVRRGFAPAWLGRLLASVKWLALRPRGAVPAATRAGDSARRGV